MACVTPFSAMAWSLADRKRLDLQRQHWCRPWRYSVKCLTLGPGRSIPPSAVPSPSRDVPLGLTGAKSLNLRPVIAIDEARKVESPMIVAHRSTQWR